MDAYRRLAYRDTCGRLSFDYHSLRCAERHLAQHTDASRHLLHHCLEREWDGFLSSVLRYDQADTIVDRHVGNLLDYWGS